jgi:hypothetical protein
MRRFGYSGLSIESRARDVGLKTMYDNCYRIASRSVHMFDPAETLLTQDVFRGRRKEKLKLLGSRRDQLEANQNMLLGRMSYLVAQYIKSGLASAELMLVGFGYEKFRDRNRPAVDRDAKKSANPPADYYEPVDFRVRTDCGQRRALI